MNEKEVTFNVKGADSRPKFKSHCGQDMCYIFLKPCRPGPERNICTGCAWFFCGTIISVLSVVAK